MSIQPCATWMLALIFTWVSLGLGCGETANTENRVSTSDSPFDHPQALRFVDDFLVVTNTGYSPDEWKPGYLSIIDPASATVINQVSTTRLNPQRIIRHNDALLVVNSGSYDLSDFDAPTTETPGSIDIFAINTLHQDTSPISTLELNEILVAPADIAFIDDRALITSSIRPKYLTATWDAQSLTMETSHALSSEDSLSLIEVKSWNGLFILVDFNSDTLSMVDGEGDLLCQLELGRQANQMEGAMSPVIHGDSLYVILALSGELRRLNLPEAQETCTAEIETIVAPLGQMPNHLLIRNDRAFVIHSGDNHVAEFDLSSGEETHRWVLPVASNPWAVAISDDGRTMGVTKWAQPGVTLIDLETGREREVSAENNSVP